MNIHSTSIVSPGAELGAGVSVGPYAVIEEDTEIGEGSDIRAHAVIKRFTTLGPVNTGIAIIEAPDEAAARKFMDEDPVIAGGYARGELRPFRVSLLRGRD